MKRLFAAMLILALALSMTACIEKAPAVRPQQSGLSQQETRPADIQQQTQPAAVQQETLAFRLDYYYDCEDIYSRYSMESDSYDYSGKNIALNARDCQAFIAWVEQLETVYEKAELYQLDSALTEYEKYKDQICTSHEGMLENITPQALMAQVKENNQAYLQQDDMRHVASLYNQFSDSDLLRICTIICDTVNLYIDQGAEQDTQQVRCVLGDLKIFDRPVMSNAYVSDDNCLIISTNVIGTMGIKLDAAHQDQDLFYGTISHEAIHMLQKGCRHDNETVYRIGFAYEFPEQTMQPLFTNWFYEGAAEKMVVNATGYMPIVYEGSIKRINAMTLSTILRQENGVRTVEETTLQHSLDALFETFGCTSDADRREVLNMMFSLQVLLIEDEAFMGALDPNLTDAEKSDIWQDMKSSISLTLTKYFYRNLAQLLQEQEMPLNDVFYLITLLEQEVNSSLRLGDEHRQQVSAAFLRSYSQMQDQFFQVLATGCGLTQQELTERYLAYELATPEKTANCDLSYLPEEKQAFFHFLCSINYLNSLKLRTLIG